LPMLCGLDCRTGCGRGQSPSAAIRRLVDNLAPAAGSEAGTVAAKHEVLLNDTRNAWQSLQPGADDQERQARELAAAAIDVDSAAGARSTDSEAEAAAKAADHPGQPR
jgi:hypothetical protein